MSDAFRRVILLPPDVAAEPLVAALQEAVAVQTRLAAKSPYILRFTGALEQDERGLFVVHEPAEPMVPASLFDGSVPPATDEQLIQVTAALVDALAAAHAAGSGRPVVHGGLCAGVLLTGEDGLPRVTDFGFAPAFCKAFGVESYLNLAVGPQAGCTAAWEVLDNNVIDRDDRICAFVDPDKYGSNSLQSFETGSDIIAAGIILFLLGERNHPYLFDDHEAHRVVDMARMMGFGVPHELTRRELCESTNPAIRSWCEAVTAMVAGLPRERPSAGDLARRFEAAARVNLDAIKAKRWLQQLEALAQASAWKDFEVAVKDRPALPDWPPEVLARVEKLQAQVKDAIAEEARRAAIEADRKVAEEWLQQVVAAANAQKWDAAHRLLAEKPRVTHWPESVEQQLAPVAKRILQVWEERQARGWRDALQRAYDHKEWAAVGRGLGERPAITHWPQDVQDFIKEVEGEYKQILGEQERQRRRIAREHKEAQAWLARAQSLTAEKQWEAALDVLDKPPELEHWPEGTRLAAEELAQQCRAQLGESLADNLANITTNVTRLAAAAVQDVLAHRLEGLLRPEQVETKAELIVWSSPTPGADGHAQVVVQLTQLGEARAEPPIQGEVDFRLEADQVRLCGRQAEFGQHVGETLARRLTELQRARLEALARGLQAGLFPKAQIQGALAEAKPHLAVEVALLGPGVVDGVVATELQWADDALAWQPADSAAFAGRTVEVATAVTQRAALADIFSRSELLRTYERVVELGLSGPPPARGRVPTSLTFETRVTVRIGERGQPQVLAMGRTTCAKVGRVTVELDVATAEAELRELLVAAQDKSRKMLEDELKEFLSKAPVKSKVAAPKRSKTPVDQIAFEVKPKNGEALALVASWDPATLAYRWPKDWRDRTNRAVAPPAPPPPPPPPVERKPKPEPARPPQPEPKAPPRPAPRPAAAAPVAPEQKPPAVPTSQKKPAAPRPEPVPETPRLAAKPAREQPPATRPRRRGLVIGAALVGVAIVVGAGLYVALRPSPQPPPTLPPPTTATGACCLTDGSCQVLAAAACAQAGGRYQGDESACAPEACAPPTGACCASDGSCRTATETECGQAGGRFQGKGTTCESKPCDQPAGACCAADGGCQVVTEAACRQAGGQFRSEIKTCEPNPCAQPGGACCAGDGSCRVVTAAECGAAGGAYQGHNKPCEPNPCPQPQKPKVGAQQSLADHLKGVLGGEPQAASLDRLLGVLAGGDVQATRTFLASTTKLPFVVRYGEPQGEDRLDVEVRLNAIGGIGERAFVASMRREGEQWTPDPTNTKRLTALVDELRGSLRDAVKRAAAAVLAARQAGNLKAAAGAAAGVQDLVRALGDDPAAQDLAQAVAKLPPAWDQKQAQLTSQGYQADGDADVASGYPARLKDSQGRVLVLVSVPPGDELWDAVKKAAQPNDPLAALVGSAADQRPWLLFYVDEKEQAAANYDGARTAAAGVKREMPTRDEWVLSALRLRSNLPGDLLGGRREWCAEEGTAPGTKHWVCGGVTRTVQGSDVVIPPLPKDTSDLATLWNWLKNPLVMQQREAKFGDEQTAVRPVLRVFAK